jgi:hypothetical protein
MGIGWGEATVHPKRPTRALVSVKNAKNGIIYWRCSACHWTPALGSFAKGLVPSQETAAAFEEHKCESLTDSQPEEYES